LGLLQTFHYLSQPLNFRFCHLYTSYHPCQIRIGLPQSGFRLICSLPERLK